MDDPVKRFIDDAMKTPLDQLMKALIESGTPKPEDQIDLSWGGVAYCAQRLSLQGNNYWRVLFTGIPIPEYHHLEKGSMAHGIFYSLGGELFNEFTLLDITPRSDSFNFFPLLDSPLDKPLNTLNLRRCQDLQTAVLYAKQFIETYKNTRTALKPG